MNVFDLNLEEGEQRPGRMLLGIISSRVSVKGVLHKRNGKLSFSYLSNEEMKLRGGGDILPGHYSAWGLSKQNNDFDHDSFEPHTPSTTHSKPKFKNGDRVVEIEGGRQITSYNWSYPL